MLINRDINNEIALMVGVEEYFIKIDNAEDENNIISIIIKIELKIGNVCIWVSIIDKRIITPTISPTK